MTLFGKKEKEEAANVALEPPVVKNTFQSRPGKDSKNVAQDRAEESTTLFGKNLKITGSVRGEGNMIIQGDFEGEFNLKGQLKVAQGASAKGNFHATSIAVNGNVDGTLTAAEKIHMDNTARINGRIVTPKVSILDGAVFDGEMQMGKKSSQKSNPSTARPTPTPAESASAETS